MKVLGITGPTGSGKSLVSDFLKEKGIPCIDADAVYHKLLIPPSECLDAIRTAFGDEVLAPDGSLDRTRLAAIVFTDADKLELLNTTVLDRVLDKIRLIISDYAQKGYTTVVVDAPTLIESGFDKECGTVLSVLAPAKKRLQRIMERDGLTEQKATERVKAQKSDAYYIEHSDYVIINDESAEKLKNTLFSILDTLDMSH